MMLTVEDVLRMVVSGETTQEEAAKLIKAYLPWEPIISATKAESRLASPAGPDALAEPIDGVTKGLLDRMRDWTHVHPGTEISKLLGEAIAELSAVDRSLAIQAAALRSRPAQGGRDAVIEECARVCEAQIEKEESRGRLQSRSILTRAATTIRSIKTKEK